LVRPPSEIRSRATRRCFERIERRLPVHVGLPKPDDLATVPLVVDAMLGTGQSDRLRPPIREASQCIRTSGAPVLSVDLPTGTRDPEDGIHPRWTVTLTTPKSEMDPGTAGEVVVRDIGIPREAWDRTGPGEFVFFRAPTGRTDRGRAARVVVIGGGPYSGAPALAALAALRSGAERATVLAPGGSAERVQSFSPNLIVRSFGSERFRASDVDDLLEFLRAAPPRAVALGMGAGAHPETVEALQTVLRTIVGTVPLVVDADGLAALPTAEVIAAHEGGAAVLATPNAGEFDRWFGGRSIAPGDRHNAVRRLASERRIFLFVKGEPDLLSDGETVVENHYHHPAMTVGGSGDVLAGTLASLLGQGLTPLAAARLAAYWVGEAGILAASRRGFGLLATDVIEELPAALVAGIARVAGPG
jgi:NAD(P)H-hydrate epimerase